MSVTDFPYTVISVSMNRFIDIPTPKKCERDHWLSFVAQLEAIREESLECLQYLRRRGNYKKICTRFKNLKDGLVLLISERTGSNFEQATAVVKLWLL